MRPWLILLAVCVYPFVLFSQVNIINRGEALEYEFQIENFKIEDEILDKEKFKKITLEGVDGYEGVYQKKGEPVLPVIRFYVNGPGEIQISKTDAAVSTAPETLFNLIRGTDPVPKISGATKHKALSVESSLDWDSNFEVRTVGKTRGIIKRLVTLFPVHWNATTGELRKTTSFKVTVPDVTEKRIEEPLMVLVIADRFSESDAIEKFIKHKNSLGIRVEKLQLTTEEKDPELIRSQLMKLYAKNPDTLKYVLLIGGARLLPGFHSERVKGITDHYYRCLDGKEYESDIGTPDVLLGRLSVKSEEELDVQVQKILDYENLKFDNLDWLKRASFIATNDKEHWKVAEESSQYTITKYTESRGYSGSFPSVANPGGDKLYAVTYKASGKHVLNSIYEGRGYIQYSGHGFSGSWDYPRLTIEEVESIENTDALPVVIANACDTAKITAVDSIAESWMRNKSGAIFYWGAMDSAYWDEDVVLQKKLSDEIFGAGNRMTGAFTSAALSDVWRYYGGQGESKYYWEVYLSLGDPSLQIKLK